MEAYYIIKVESDCGYQYCVFFGLTYAWSFEEEEASKFEDPLRARDRLEEVRKIEPDAYVERVSIKRESKRERVY